MTMRTLQSVSPADLPEYPIGREVRMPTHYFVPLQFNRWLNSSLHLMATYEVQGIATALICLAQNQSPVGTLPADDAMLARLLRIDEARWRDLSRAAIGPLHGWERCLSDGEIRWMHPVVLEVVQDALSRREARELSHQGRARERRIQRMVEAFRGLGAPEALLEDRAALDAIEDHLAETCRGNRTAAHYVRALRWAGVTKALKG